MCNANVLRWLKVSESEDFYPRHIFSAKTGQERTDNIVMVMLSVCRRHPRDIIAITVLAKKKKGICKYKILPSDTWEYFALFFV